MCLAASEPQLQCRQVSKLQGGLYYNVNLLSHKSRANEHRHEHSRDDSHDQSGHALRTKRLRTMARNILVLYCKFGWEIVGNFYLQCHVVQY